MIELFKKTMLTGIGVAVLTKEKVEELAQEFVEQGNISREEGTKFVDDIMKRSKESQEEMSRQVEKLVHDGLNKLDIVQQEELNGLREELAAIRERLDKLEQQ